MRFSYRTSYKDGSEPLSRALDAYPELFAVVGGQVPDLRGLFLRGHGGNSAALGVRQGDAIRNITGGAGYIQFHQNTGGAAGAFYLSGNGGRARINGSEYEPYLNFDASRVVPTAEENRPVNTAVRFLVRARP